MIDQIHSGVGYELITAPHQSHASIKLVFASQSLTLQKFHLLLFATAINSKVIEVRSGHGHSVWSGLSGATTTQAGSDNADAKYDTELAHDSFHSHAHFAKVDEEQPAGFRTSL